MRCVSLTGLVIWTGLPRIGYGADHYPLLRAARKKLDLASVWAEKYGLRTLLDLHAATGCQNDFDSGPALAWY
jgi:aryl-phospho-beta-D-glucosidase BglC (GH1 family)